MMYNLQDILIFKSYELFSLFLLLHLYLILLNVYDDDFIIFTYCCWIATIVVKSFLLCIF